MKDKITKEKLEKYFNLKSKALETVKSNIISGKKSQAKEIIDMVENYLSDAKHFEKKEDFAIKLYKITFRKMEDTSVQIVDEVEI